MKNEVKISELYKEKVINGISSIITKQKFVFSERTGLNKELIILKEGYLIHYIKLLYPNYVEINVHSLMADCTVNYYSLLYEDLDIKILEKMLSGLRDGKLDDNDKIIKDSCDLADFLLRNTFKGKIDEKEHDVTYYSEKAQIEFDKLYDLIYKFYSKKDEAK